MDAKEIIDATRRMSLGKQKYIANWIVWNIDKIEHRQSAEERCATIMSAVEQVTNMTNDPARKDNDSVFVRTLTAWRMMDEGYTKMDISRAIGRDHSTIVYIHKLRKTAEQLPNAYRQHLYFFDKLNKSLNDANDR